MTAPDSRRDALKLLLTWFSSDLYIDHLIRNHHVLIPPQDRRFRDALIHLTLQWQRQLDHILKSFLTSGRKPPQIVYILLLMGTAEILHMSGTKDHGTVHTLVSLAGYHKKFVNAVLRQIIRFRDSGAFEKFKKDPSVLPGIRHSFPDWLTDRWKNQFGDELESLLESLNRPPVRTIRLMDESRREEVIRHLTEKGQYLKIHPDHEEFIVVKSIQSIPEDPFFRNGVLTIQDVSSSLPEFFFPDGKVTVACDVCCAPGGKTAAMRKKLGKDVNIHAYDSEPKRLEQAAETLKRLDYHGISLETADARYKEFPKADLFLVDAPCSGFGALQKRSDLRWRRRPEDIETLTRLQQDILHNVSRSVRSGGRIVYSTCTFDREENLGTLNAFLNDHPEFTWCEFPSHAPDGWKDEEAPVLRTLPHRHGCEGSFAGAVKRT